MKAIRMSRTGGPEVLERPAIQERIPLAEAARAHALLESGKVLGKLVLEP